ncbi:YheC/YheD family endospore coat-associated protein [Paenibacillus eucommiae]|uniref:Glutathione synthase/RimK-type ligase-like ATP-grasp enzyme n=1 Tax=Paenibacillus eucommiae TaxID=1355755 RepID=A0ABS4INP2_9BACL|nr:YheC/YheD family protein [Paenibacillus eucommiae]MBP1989175.1 glutathione synthase/RimK-type ligase-like ATP-grasp enzyme [Paenibacillus eucommiae]
MMIKLRGSASIRKEAMQIPKELVKKWCLANEQTMMLKFGTSTIPIKTQASRILMSNEIIISNIALQKLKVPAECAFQLKKVKNTLIIGPYIGLLVDRKKGNIPLQDLIHYSQQYGPIGGAILAFSPENVDTNNKTITGFMFKPLARSWKHGQFRYPSSIFNKSSAKKPLIDHFNQVLGKNVFNDYRCDKWMMYKLLSQKAALREFLPKTALFEQTRDVMQMLKHCPVLYLKPINGSGGQHILKLAAASNKFIVTYKEARKGYVNKHFAKPQQLVHFLNKQAPRKKYLLQERIKLISSKGRLIDFRMIVVKDEIGKWRDMGLLSKYGQKNHIVSNITAGGFAEEGNRTLRKVLQLGNKEIRSIRNKMQSCALEIARQLEASGFHLGNLGIDFAIDTNKKLWIIEVNHNDPNHTIALDAGEHKMFARTIKANLLYAKKLAGFARSSRLATKRR